MNPRSLAAVLFAACLIVPLAAEPAAGAKLSPTGGPLPVVVETSGKAYTYFPLTAGRPLTLRAGGPAVIEVVARWRFGESEHPVDVEVEFTVDGEETWRHIFRALPGKASVSYPDLPGKRPGRPVRLSFDIPSRSHSVEIALVAPADGIVDLNLLSGKPGVLPWRFGWRAEMGLGYDSNIFRYSDSDVDDFLDGDRPDHYAMESTDDLRVEPSLDLALTREEPGVRSTGLKLLSDWRLATSNGEKSFARLGVSLREERHGVAYLSASYSAIPSYHVRRLWDGDADGGVGGYRSCDFRKHAFRIEVGSDRSLPVDAALSLKIESYGYDPDFVEYGSSARTAGLRATLRPASGVRIDLAYALRSLTARGWDQVGETRATSDDSDTTYDQDEYSVRLRWEAGMWWGRRAVLSTGVTHLRRFYLSSRPADDPYHAGRDDAYWTAGARVRLEFSSVAGAEGFYQYRARTAESPVVIDLGELKDYTAHRVGFLIYLEGGQFLD